MTLSYDELIQKQGECNYIDLETSNSSDILLSCINKPNEINPITNNKGRVNISIEGFSSDMSSVGGGVSYIPKGTCHDGYQKDENGKCIQKWSGRVREGDLHRDIHNVSILDGKENYKICGNNNFLGIDNSGYLKCDINESTKEENDIPGFDNEVNYLSEPAPFD